jgi:hypothetical protein
MRFGEVAYALFMFWLTYTLRNFIMSLPALLAIAAFCIGVVGPFCALFDAVIYPAIQFIADCYSKAKYNRMMKEGAALYAKNQAAKAKAEADAQEAKAKAEADAREAKAKAEAEAKMKYANPYETPGGDQKTKSVITPAQIKMLSALRDKLAYTDLKMFPYITVHGDKFKDVIPDNGLFTAKIIYKGEPVHLIAMVRTPVGVSSFAQAVYQNTTGSKEYRSGGYLIPSKAGLFYSVLLVTYMTINGRQINI